MITWFRIVSVLAGTLWLVGCASLPGAQTSQPSMVNPASAFCEQHGGRLEMRSTEDGGQFGVCIFADDSECEEWAFFRGECIPGSDSFASVDEAIRGAMQFMAQELGLELQEIELASIENQEWADTCLGLPAGGEACPQVATAGVRFGLKAGETLTYFRISQEGGRLRLEP